VRLRFLNKPDDVTVGVRYRRDQLAAADILDLPVRLGAGVEE